MPSLANITILDRATTPVSHVFKPRDLNKGRAFTYEDNSDFSPIGENQLSYQVDFLPGNRRKADSKLEFFKTTTEVINGVSVKKILDVARFTGKIEFGPSYTPSEKEAFVGAVMKLFDTAANQPVLNKIQTCAEKNYG